MTSPFKKSAFSFAKNELDEIIGDQCKENDDNDDNE